MPAPNSLFLSLKCNLHSLLSYPIVNSSHCSTAPDLIWGENTFFLPKGECVLVQEKGLLSAEGSGCCNYGLRLDLCPHLLVMFERFLGSISN